jgi:hypothetical protein
MFVTILEGVMCLVSDPWSAPGVQSLLSGKMELQEYSSLNVPLIVVTIFEGVMCLVSDPWGAPGVRSLLSGKMEQPGVFSSECPLNCCRYI